MRNLSKSIFMLALPSVGICLLAVHWLCQSAISAVEALYKISDVRSDAPYLLIESFHMTEYLIAMILLCYVFSLAYLWHRVYSVALRRERRAALVTPAEPSPPASAVTTAHAWSERKQGV